MHDDGEWLNDRALGGAEVSGQGQQIMGRKIHELAKEAGLTDSAEEANVRADVVMAAEAELTVVAIVGRLQNSGIAYRPAGYAGSDFRNDTRGLVTYDHRVHAGRIAHATIREIVQVGTADADGGDTGLNFAWSGIGDGRSVN